jgi:GDP-L-fucose synthase
VLIGYENMARWLVAGSSGMAGRAIVRAAKNLGVTDIIEVSSQTCDLRDYQKTRNLLMDTRPSVVIDAAAKVGGILANSTHPVEFMTHNLQIQTNLFSASHEADVQKLVFLSSSCVYPKNAPQPITESSILTGPLEETNSSYAIAKIAGMRLIQAYRQQFNRDWISVMPTNLFGSFDNFSTTSGHFLPAFIRKFHEAKINDEKQVVLWGSGKPRRELMEIDEFARALMTVINDYDGGEIINIGTGKDLSIKEISDLVKNVVGFEGEIIWDSSKPDGTPRKLLDVTKLQALGYSCNEDLETSILKTYEWFKLAKSQPNSGIRIS